MNIALWSLQVIAGIAFIGAGLLKATQPTETLSKRMAWVSAVTPLQVRAIGIAEFLGGLGLIIPAATGILPWLTPVAAICLALIMLGAVAFHISRKENNQIVPPLVLMVLALAIAVGRSTIEPII